MEVRQVTKEDITRINELYHKSQTAEGLTAEEQAEQAALRSAYLAAVRANLRSQLNRIDIQESDGSITHLRDLERNRENGSLQDNA